MQGKAVRHLTQVIDRDGNFVGDYMDMHSLSRTIDSAGALICWRGSVPVMLQRAPSRRASQLFQDVTTAWIQVNNEPVPVLGDEADQGGEEETEKIQLPSFQDHWYPEFEEAQGHPVHLRILAAFLGPPMLYSTSVYLLGEDGTYGSWQWALLNWAGYGMVILGSLVTFSILMIPSAPIQNFALAYFRIFASISIVCAFAGATILV